MGGGRGEGLPGSLPWGAHCSVTALTASLLHPGPVSSCYFLKNILLGKLARIFTRTENRVTLTQAPRPSLESHQPLGPGPGGLF